MSDFCTTGPLVPLKKTELKNLSRAVIFDSFFADQLAAGLLSDLPGLDLFHFCPSSPSAAADW